MACPILGVEDDVERLARVLFLATFIAVCSYSSAPAATDSVQIEGVTIAPKDMQLLLAALHTALQPNDNTIPILVSVKKPSEMPSYDPQSHYAGAGRDSNGARDFQVWISGDLKGKDMENAITGAFVLAVTDGGYAGPAFKKLYDVLAQEDAQLPATATDPFLNRHRFAAALIKQINSTQ